MSFLVAKRAGISLAIDIILIRKERPYIVRIIRRAGCIDMGKFLPDELKIILEDSNLTGFYLAVCIAAIAADIIAIITFLFDPQHVWLIQLAITTIAKASEAVR